MCRVFRSFQQIEYAKSPSHATLKSQNPDFVPPRLNKSNLAIAASKINKAGPSTTKVTVSHAENDERKRARDDEDEDDDDERDGKKRRSDSEGMEVDEDEPAPAKGE